MIFRDARGEDIAAIANLERTPEFRSFVGNWPIEEHFKNLDDPDACYIVAEDADRSIAAFAVLRGLLSEHKSLELKRIVVGKPNRGIGRKLLQAALERAFGEFAAHRLWLDVFETNDRARHLYASAGFQTDGIFREAYHRDGQFHSLMLMSILDWEYRSLAQEKRVPTKASN
jgi:RimJ/RimL family protein N-acetyltransferase